MVEIMILSVLIILLLQGGCSLDASIDGGEPKRIELIWDHEDYSKHLSELQEEAEAESKQ